ncbi:heparinase II/III family protein, partial [Thermodesulfobacteriota bacterium]
IALLQKELEEQVLSDGGHFERNPGYHAAVLKDCLEIGQFLRLNGDGTTYTWLENAIDQNRFVA